MEKEEIAVMLKAKTKLSDTEIDNLINQKVSKLERKKRMKEIDIILDLCEKIGEEDEEI